MESLSLKGLNTCLDVSPGDMVSGGLGSAEGTVFDLILGFIFSLNNFMILSLLFSPRGIITILEQNQKMADHTLNLKNKSTSLI